MSFHFDPLIFKLALNLVTQLCPRQNCVKHVFTIIHYTAYPALYDIIVKCDTVHDII